MEGQHILDRAQEKQLQTQENYYSKVFDFGLFRADYSNSNVMKNVKPNQRTPTLMISNYLCKKQGNLLTKITQIRLDDKVITIEDQYSIVLSEAPSDVQIHSFCNSVKNDGLEQERSTKKPKVDRKKTNRTLMPKKRHLKFNDDFDDDQQKREQRRDTKNVPRNIIRTFSNYLFENQMPEFSQIMKLTQKLGYNNALVEDVIRHKDLNLEFRNFLIQPAKTWLNQSKIKDKRSHFQAIDIYLKMTERQLGKINEEFSKQNHQGQILELKM